MCAVKISSPTIIFFAISVVAGNCALADEFTCKNISLTRKSTAVPAIVNNPLSKQTTLDLNIDKVTPSHSTLRRSGDPVMEGITSNWPDDTHIIVEKGAIAASFSVTKNGFSSVGTATLDASGELRMTESTLTPQGVIFDVVEGKCHQGHE